MVSSEFFLMKKSENVFFSSNGYVIVVYQNISGKKNQYSIWNPETGNVFIAKTPVPEKSRYQGNSRVLKGLGLGFFEQKFSQSLGGEFAVVGRMGF